VRTEYSLRGVRDVGIDEANRYNHDDTLHTQNAVNHRLHFQLQGPFALGDGCSKSYKVDR